MLEMILSPVLAASGVDYKPGQVQKKQARKNRTDEEKDRDLLRQLSRAPIGVKVVKGQKTHADAKGKG